MLFLQTFPVTELSAMLKGAERRVGQGVSVYRRTGFKDVLQIGMVIIK